MELAEWQEQGYHLAGVVITFTCAWTGIAVALMVESCSTVATSFLSVFAGGVLFAGGMCHLLGDALEVLRLHSESHGQLLALSLASTTYLLLYVLHTSITGHLGTRLSRVKKKVDQIRLMSEEEEEEEDERVAEGGDFTVHTTPSSSSLRHLDEAELFLASLQNQGLRSSALLMAVLSIHSFLAGLAFGSQPDPAEEFKIMIPIAAHKSLAAMALTVTLKKARMHRFNMFVLLLVFSFSTPAGTFVGMIVSSSVESSLWTGLCLAIAAGTFIFVTLNDILPAEITKDPDTLKGKCAVLLTGFAFMALLALWV